MLTHSMKPETLLMHILKIKLPQTLFFSTIINVAYDILTIDNHSIHLSYPTNHLPQCYLSG